ncbi:beta-ketoacyl-ACP synthase III [Nannocystis pusilla]|uniref:beta-ketoacyl-ACP synthase III n=1 Tax=Nannocystis pusilla TaxID=889268 RepID=UPI003BF08D13
MRRFKILATARALPPRVLTNAELETMIDTTDQWIVERTGIRERRIAAPEVATSDLAAEALLSACNAAGLGPEALDVLIVATSTPDTLFPSTACWVQHKLGLRGPAAFDVSAGCSGWLYGMELAASLIAGGGARTAAVIGAEVMSKVVNWEDRSTCVLFGDGAGAAILTACEEDRGLLGSAWGADGTLARVLYQPAGGTRQPASAESVAARAHTVHMEGNTVFKHAVTAMSEGAIEALKRAGVTPEDVTLLIPHQANTRIMEATRARTAIAPAKMVSIVDRYGNMSAATIPVALDEARAAGRLKDGDLLAMTAFGTGFTWAAQVLRV